MQVKVLTSSTLLRKEPQCSIFETKLKVGRSSFLKFFLCFFLIFSQVRLVALWGYGTAGLGPAGLVAFAGVKIEKKTLPSLNLIFSNLIECSTATWDRKQYVENMRLNLSCITLCLF